MHRAPCLAAPAALSALLILAAGCTNDVARSNPFDPDGSGTKHPGRIAGSVWVEARPTQDGLTVRIFDAESTEADAVVTGAQGDFLSSELQPGPYRVVLDVPAQNLPAAKDKVEVLPGQTTDAGTLISTLAPADGVLAGAVTLEQTSVTPAGVRVVATLMLDGVSQSSVQYTDAQGRYAFVGMPAGAYEVQATRERFTPDRQEATLAPSRETAEVAAMKLYPASAVVRFSVPMPTGDVIGAPYTPAREVDLLLLAFGGVNEMRFSQSPDFTEDGAAVAWREHLAQSPVTLSAGEGLKTMYAQFRVVDATENERLRTEVYEVGIIFDETPPQPVRFELAPQIALREGVRYVRPGSGDAFVTVPIEVEAFDALSTVAGIKLAQGDNDPALVPYTSLQAGASIFYATDVTVDNNDGPLVMRLGLVDGAGNESALADATVVIDGTPPLALADPALVALEAIDPETASELPVQLVTLELRIGGDAAAGIDGPARLRFGEGAPSSTAVTVPFEATKSLRVAAGHGGVVQFWGEVEDLAGNVLSVQSPSYTLNLQGSIEGTVYLEGEPDSGGDHSAALIEVVAPASGTVVAQDNALTNGSFELAGIPEGSYLVRLSAPSREPVVRSPVAVSGARTTSLGTTRLMYRRGNLVGSFRFGDKPASADHSGIQVAAKRLLHLGDTQLTTVATSYTDATGLVQFAALPVSSPGSRYTVVASHQGYVNKSVTGVDVVADVESLIAGGAPQSLLKLSGDFKICSPVEFAASGMSEPKDCVAKLYANEDSLLLGLIANPAVYTYARYAIDTGGTPGLASFSDQAATPATDLCTVQPSPQCWNDYNATVQYLLEVSAQSEGIITVVVQLAQTPTDDTQAPGIAQIIRDTQAPYNGSLEIARGAAALIDGFTNSTSMTLMLRAEASDGTTTDVAPLEEVRFGEDAVWGDSDDDSAPYGGQPVYVLGDTLDGPKTLYARFCDAAQNCTPAGGEATAGIILDRTPPSRANGVEVVPDEADAWVTLKDVAARQWWTREQDYSLLVSLGDSGHQVLLDAALYDVPEVLAYQLSSSEQFAGAVWQAVDPSLQAAGDTMRVSGVRLPPLEGPHPRYARFQDAAGNVSTETLANRVTLVLDSVAPSVGVSVAGGQHFVGTTLLTAEVASDDGVAVQWEWGVAGQPPQFAAAPVALVSPLDVPIDDTPAAADGERVLYVRVLDAAGNAGKPDPAPTVFLDRTPPAATATASCASCVLDGGAAHYSGATGQVSLALYATDNSGVIDHLEVAVDGGAPVAYAYGPQRTVDVSTAPGPHAVQVSFFDAAGNHRDLAALTLSYDNTPPSNNDLTITGTIVAGAASTTLTGTRDVRLTPQSTGATEMLISNSSGFAGALWQPYDAGPVDWTLAPGDSLAKYVYIKYRDAAHNESTRVDQAIALDTTPPTNVTLTMTGTIAGGAASTTLTGSSQVTLTLTASDANIDPLAAPVLGRIWVANDAAFSTGGFEDFRLQKAAWPLAAGSGERWVYVRVADEAGNTVVASASIQVDLDPPALASIAIRQGSVTKDLGVDLDLGATGADEMWLEGHVVEAAAWVSFAPAAARTLAPASCIAGMCTVRAKFRDQAGNETGVVSDVIELDQTRPAATLSLTGTLGDGTASSTHTSTADVMLALSGASGDAMELKVSNQPDLADAAWQPYRASLPWRLSPGDGAKSVYVALRDEAGNIGDAGTHPGLQAGIALDTVVEPATLVLAGGAAYVQSATGVLIELASADAAQMRIAVDGVLDTEVWEAFQGAVSRNLLPAGSGTKTVRAQVRDAARNASPILTEQVIVDATAPTLVSVTIGDGSGYVSSADGATFVEARCADDRVSDYELDLRVVEGGVTALYDGPYRSIVDVTLGASEVSRSITVTCTDPAGNAVTSAAIPVLVDHTPPAVALFAVEDLDDANLTRDAVERTSSVIITTMARLSDPVAGAAGDILVGLAETAASCATADYAHAAPHATDTSMAFTLAPGDRIQAIYLCARDPAGNATASATASSNSVQLDTTGPDMPALQVLDIDGDGFALSQSHVELQWSTPPDGDLAGFNLQRLIERVDTTFVALQSFDATDVSHADSTVIPGTVHSYRIRAYDDLGNASGWSMVAQARPFVPIDHVGRVRTLDSYLYEFRPNEGTFWLQATYSWENLDHSPDLTILPTNIPYFEKPFYPNRFNEALVLRVWNQDSSLVYDAEVPLRINERVAVANSGYQNQKGIAVDKGGAVHILYKDGSNGRIKYTTNTSGVWVTEWEGVNGSNADLLLDGDGKAHVCMQTSAGVLHYASNRSGSWLTETADAAAAGAGWFCSIALDTNGKAHICTYVSATTDLRYTTNTSGSWASEIVDAAGNVGESCAIALDSTDAVHISYENSTTYKTMYATGTAGGPWSVTEVGPTGRTAIAVDADDHVHIAHSYNRVYYATDASGSWVDTPLTPRGSYVDIAVLESGEVFIGHDSTNNEGDLGYTTNASGSWETRWLDTADDVGDFLSMAVDRYGGVHVTYEGPSPARLKYAVDRSRVWAGTTVEQTASSWERDTSVAVDAAGRPSFVYTNGTGTGLRHAVKTGTAWSYEGVDAGEARYPLLAADANGALHAIFVRPTTDELMYASNTTGSWTSAVAAISGADSSSFYFASLSLDQAGRAHIAHCDKTAHEVRYTTNASGSWVTEVVAAGPAIGCAVGVDSSQAIHVSYYDTTSRVFNYATNAGGGWSVTTIDTAVNIQYHSSSLVVDGSDAVHLLYWRYEGSQGLAIKYATNASGSWVTELATPVFNSGSMQLSAMLALDGDGNAHAVLLESGRRVRYASNAFGGWKSWVLAEWAVDPIWVGRPNPDLTFDRWGHGHISYIDTVGVQEDVKYLRDFQARTLPAVSVVQTEAF